MLVKANFAMLGDLNQSINTLYQGIEAEMATWTGQTNTALGAWLDNAGGEFGGVSQAWNRLGELHQQNLTGTGRAVDNTHMELANAVASSAARIGSGA